MIARLAQRVYAGAGSDAAAAHHARRESVGAAPRVGEFLARASECHSMMGGSSRASIETSASSALSQPSAPASTPAPASAGAPGGRARVRAFGALAASRAPVRGGERSRVPSLDGRGGHVDGEAALALVEEGGCPPIP